MVIMFSFICQLITCLILGQLQISAAESDTTTLAAPIVATPTQHWEGNDGIWSTFEIRVGTPQQTFRVLPATSWQETWVIWALDEQCDSSRGLPSDCGDVRGGAFKNLSSTTFEVNGEFVLGLNTDLGYNGHALYGFDTVGLGFTNSTGPTLPHQIVAAIASDTWFFGILGMGFQPTNFTGYGDPQASFADTLSSNQTISSMSWSYTAGAYYRLKSVFGSLIFGGYDASRFTPNNLTFDMTGDVSRDIVLSLQSITSNTSSGNTTLMSTPELMFIDSTVPEFWLPIDVCEEFEKAFGIELDTATDRYLLNASTHASLSSLNPTFVFKLANDPLEPAAVNTTNTIDISLPYAAFDLNVSAPIVANTTSYYFPIRRSQNSSQYTIGRTFLQEAYVTTDYNSRTFNVSQCVFENGVDADVIAIPSVMPTSTSTGSSPSSSSSSGSGSSKNISTGAIAGIAVAAVLIVLLILACMIFHLRRHHHQKLKEQTNTPMIGNPTPIHEIDPGTRVQRDSDGKLSNLTAYNEQASKPIQEVHGNDAMVEISGRPIMHPQELEAGLVPGVYYEAAREGADVESEGGDIDADNPESGTSGGEEAARKRGIGSRSKEIKGESSGEESGTTAISSLSPQTPSPRGGLTPAPSHSLAGGIGARTRAAANPFSSSSGNHGLSPSPEVSTDEENGRRGGSESDHLVSPMTESFRGSVMGRRRPGTWGSVVDGQGQGQGQGNMGERNVSISEES